MKEIPKELKCYARDVGCRECEYNKCCNLIDYVKHLESKEKELDRNILFQSSVKHDRV